MNKMLLVFLLSIVSIVVAADETLRFKGTYHFNPNFTSIVLKKRVELVVTSSDEGQERVRELRAANYVCIVRTARLTECSKFRPNTTHLNQMAIDRQNTRSLDSTITFEDGDFSPTIINNSADLKEYTFNQKVVFAGDYYSNFRMSVALGIIKLNFGSPTEKSLVVNEYGELILKSTVTIIESHLVSEMFFLESKYIHD